MPTKSGLPLFVTIPTYLPTSETDTSLKDLTEAGIANTDLYIGVTPEESKNITSCMLAANLGAKKTLARIDNYEYLLPKIQNSSRN